MPKYIVTMLYDASESVEVEADTPDEAIEAAYQKCEASLCYHCARKLELGDIYKAIVSNENGNEVGEQAA